jgi:hypothetical protein
MTVITAPGHRLPSVIHVRVLIDLSVFRA